MPRLPRPRALAEYRHLGRTLLLTVGVGLAVGAAACLFHLGVEWTQHLALDRLVHYHPPHPHGETPITPEARGPFRRWLLLFVPAVGGLLCGALVQLFAPEAGGGGGDAFIDAFHNHKGRMRRRVALVKGLASMLILGTGGSAGREGPIMQIGASIGSSLARALHLSDRERRMLLVAGTAAGMSALFRTPLGAAIFAIEVLYRDDFEADAIVAAIIASVTAYSVFITAFGQAHLFATAEHYPFRPAVLPLYLAMAVVVSLAARAFAYILHWSREHVWRPLPVPAWVKPGLGGLAVGVIAVAIPPASGIGYGWLQEAILWTGGFGLGWRSVALLLFIALAKMVATSCTISSGGSGGDFGPSLVVGGMIGSACGQVFHLVMPGFVAQSPGAFALVGMATFFGGIAHVPIASLIMVCELTGSYDLLVPLMFTEGLAFVLLRNASLYHAQVQNQAMSPAHHGELAIDILGALTVADALAAGREPIAAVPATMPMRSFLERVAATDHAVFPVADAAGRLCGLVSMATVRALLFEDVRGAPLIVGDALEPLLLLTREQPLSEALEQLLAAAQEELPVVAKGDRETVVGMLGFAELVRAYHQELARRRSGAAAAAAPR